MPRLFFLLKLFDGVTLLCDSLIFMSTKCVPMLFSPCCTVKSWLWKGVKRMWGKKSKKPQCASVVVAYLFQVPCLHYGTNLIEATWGPQARVKFIKERESLQTTSLGESIPRYNSSEYTRWGFRISYVCGNSQLEPSSFGGAPSYQFFCLRSFRWVSETQI